MLVELEEAGQTRDIAWAASAGEPPGVQERYEADKRAALARVEAVLPRTPAGENLRARLEEWIDALR